MRPIRRGTERFDLRLVESYLGEFALFSAIA